jgi:hypothetical protein
MKLLGLALAGAFLIGCAPVNESTVVGKYKGVAQKDTSAGNIANNLMSGMASSLSLELKPDKTFHLLMAIVPVDGRWSLDGTILTLTPDKVLGITRSDIPLDPSKPMTFKVIDGQLQPEGSQGQFRFLKEGSQGDISIP